jgi:hypothetical protein
MGKIKGGDEFKDFEAGKPLTRMEAIEANCYTCNGEEDVDCKAVKTCPLYQWSPYNPNQRKLHAGGEGNMAALKASRRP